jgi:hypothetical protein
MDTWTASWEDPAPAFFEKSLETKTWVNQIKLFFLVTYICRSICPSKPSLIYSSKVRAYLGRALFRFSILG